MKTACLAALVGCATTPQPNHALHDAGAALALVCAPGLVVQTAAEPNGRAVPVHGGLLLHNRAAIAQIGAEYGHDAAVAIYAHELGHLCDYHHEQPPTEPSADMWAGCALAVTGGSPDGYLRLIDERNDGKTPIAIRKRSVVDGFRVCGGLWAP